jgi:hypothetical protein
VAAVNLGGRPFRIIAGSISAQNLAQRVAVPRTGDELQRISETWNEVLERVEIPVKRIRQFTADTSYKLSAATWGARRHQFVTRRPRVTMFGA